MVPQVNKYKYLVLFAHASVAKSENGLNQHQLQELLKCKGENFRICAVRGRF